MKDILEFLSVLLIFIIFVLFIGLLIFSTQIESKSEYTKLLEQSLNEQIQEKQVYMNMLEGKDE